MKILLSLILLLHATAAVAGPLEDMAGEWSGAGTARADMTHGMEPVRCHLQADLSRGALTIQGLCAVAGRRMRLAGSLSMDAAGAISGRWRNPDGDGSASVAGSATGNEIRYTVTPPVGADRRPRLLRWVLGPDGGLLLDISIANISGGTLASVQFTRGN